MNQSFSYLQREEHCMDEGFTLVELMIVIAIIGILAAIAIPSMLAYSKRAHQAVAVSECKEVYNSFVKYYLDTVISG
ncbi:prepilin-type N-terminal cleavage/methylation domain-containing protein [Thermodesulfobacteriota bacterium]